MVVCGPYSGGQSHQRQPLFSTCTMPLITRRSSARLTPRTSVGRRGSIRSHCSSLSQNRFLRTAPSLPNESSHVGNQDCVSFAAELMSFQPNNGTAVEFRWAYRDADFGSSTGTRYPNVFQSEWNVQYADNP